MSRKEGERELWTLDFFSMYSVHVGLDPSDSAGSHLHLVLEFLPDPRHSKKMVSLTSFRVVTIGLGKPHRVPPHQYGNYVHHHGHHVAEGKVAYDMVIL